MFKYFYLFIAIAIFYNKFRLTKKIHKQETVKGIVKHQWVTKLIYYFYLVPFIFSPIEFFLVDRKINYLLSLTALLIYTAGLQLSAWARKTIGKYWTVEIEIRENHPLIKQGPYKYMRHPHYLYTFIELFALPLIANAYYTLLVTALIFIPVLTFRIIFEEKEMINKLGDEYLKYKKEVWGLFPFPVFKKGVGNEE